jgi:hypothetical protein
MKKRGHYITEVCNYSFGRWTYVNKFMIAVFILVFTFSGCGGSEKYKRAYITEKGGNFVITLRGRGTGHPAGPTDILFPKTFEDSIELIVPMSIDTIPFDKVKELVPEDSDRFVTLVFSKGYVFVSKSNLAVDLYQTYPEYPPNDPLYWNGDYDLIWK